MGFFRKSILGEKKILPTQLHELLNLFYPEFVHTLLERNFWFQSWDCIIQSGFAFFFFFSIAVGKLEMLLH